MDADSQDENNMNEDYNSPIEEPKKPKRQMKTPYQLEILENTYALEPYPSEVTRSGLSEKLNLTDRQLQMWFCHRRLKEKKDGTVKQPLQATGKVRKRESFDNPNMDLLAAVGGGSDHGSESGSGPLSQLGPVSDSGSDGSTSPSNHYVNEAPIPNRYYETPESLMAWKVISCVELQLGEPLRKDGPILGMEFDDPPPGAFGVPKVMADAEDRSRKALDHKSVKQRDVKPNKTLRKGPHEYASEGIGMEMVPIDHHGGSSSMNSRGNEQLHRAYRQPNHHQMDYYHIAQRGTSADAQMGVLSSAHPHETHITSSEDGSAMDKNRKTDEGRSGRKESSEKRIRKELEKQDNLRRRMEETMRKEMERQDRDRQKEEEKSMREKQRQEERYHREEKRETERREKFLQRELLRAEKMKQKEDLRVERELVKQRIAMERATARKIAKESMELIEDERLELMELAALKKGLPAITSLDHDTLQNLELFREFLIQFPPKSVQLKRPFAISPWIDSDENIGNLLMVWRFCTTFADAMGIWPFTLDELVQAFHEYDSRLLGEIHISLLKLVIMDIENVSRTSSVSVGANQIAASNPDGGHPHVVDGAYKWGFDIRDWKKHLGPMSWPEILRQFALSAGFGPKLKKKGVVGKTSLPDEEAKGCEDAVSSLRNGVAAEKAAAQMQGKGFSSQKKSRHRLTPGTLKYAAYSVLSLEGSEGLTVIKLAQKVQEFGLRNLSTSKTPEASISVALSRDTVLFERTAPSTYRVRTPFRKDPVDAESILSAAREKINRYENGFSNERNAVDVEKDESEGDGEEIAEVEDVDTLDIGKDRSSQTDFTMSCATENKNLSKFDGNSMSESLEPSLKNPEQGCSEIDESKSGEPWVLGLTEGEYSDLPVRERLNALVALVGIVNEGTSIRAVIEERFENTSALKKQMLAEAQLDKKRIKEEGMSKSHHASSMGEDEIKQENMNNIPQDESLINTFQSICNNLHSQATERARLGLKSYIGQKAEETYTYRALPLGQDRRRNRYWKFGASASVHDPGSGRIFVESLTGQWRVIDSEEAFDALLTSLDTRGIRESHLQIMLREIEKSFRKNIKNNCLSSEYENGIRTKAEIDTSPACSGGDLDSPQSMVSGLVSTNVSDELSTSFKIQLGRNEAERKDALNRYQEFQLWMWRECFNTESLCAKKSVEKRSTKPVLEICGFCLDLFMASDELLCPCCNRPFADSLTYFDQEAKGEVSNPLNFAQPARIGLLKVLLTYIEFSLPSEALLPSWTEDNRRMEWGMQLHESSSIEGLLQALTELESAIQRDYLSKTYDKTEELMASYSLSGYSNPNSGSSVQLPWLPLTTAAIALRLLDLDGSICYTSDLTEFNSRQIVVEPIPVVVLDVKQGKRASTSVSRGSRKRAVRPVKSNCKPARQDGQVLEPLPIHQQARGVERIGTGPRTVRKKRPRLDTKLGQDNVFDCRSGSSLNYNSSPEDDGEEPNGYSSMEEEPINNHGITQDIPMDEDDKSSSEADESDDDDKVIYPPEEEEEEEEGDDAFQERRRDGTLEANEEDEDSSDSEDESSEGYSD
ncbi:homeobox-DDT domain protein RLT1-like isoform X2 [Impatiens glandulifera]|uniref:homeobox-DDT domain protein RLT1-like isoform X2 n=1 Tax=Impatiens glandulifera TaxID=253017 RepID=UPI001FB11C1A|nr:homeobox-DDT domain protein RLT1-like isoform X2 [Impatiens glandulifera]